MDKKRIVFIPAFHYSSNPAYFNLAKHLRGSYELIYLNTNDPLQIYGMNRKGIKEEEILRHFDDYIAMPDIIFHRSSSFFSHLFFLPSWYSYRTAIERQLSALRPSAIVCSTDMGPFSLQVANEWALRNKIPFLILQTHLVFLQAPARPVLKKKIIYLLFNRLLGLPFSTRQFAVGKEHPQNILLVWNLSLQKRSGKNPCHAVGNYSIDKVRPSTRRYSTICNEAPFSTREEWLGAVHSLLKNNPKDTFFLKLHPADDESFFRKEFSLYRNCTVKKDFPLARLIPRSRLMITVNSRVALDFVMNGVPLVLYPFKDNKDPDFFKNEIELRASSPAELQQAYTKAKTSAYLKGFFSKKRRYQDAYLGDFPDKKKTLAVFSRLIR